MVIRHGGLRHERFLPAGTDRNLAVGGWASFVSGVAGPPCWEEKRLHIAIGAMLFSLWFGGAFWKVAGKKMYWDAKVRELCVKDGGIKVYETVELSPNFIDKFGRISIPEKSDAKSTDEYYYESFRDYSQNGDLTISRVQHQIVRRRDGKVLGELIRYGRSGGDLYGPWERQVFCAQTRLTQQISKT